MANRQWGSQSPWQREQERQSLIAQTRPTHQLGGSRGIDWSWLPWVDEKPEPDEQPAWFEDWKELGETWKQSFEEEKPKPKKEKTISQKEFHGYIDPYAQQHLSIEQQWEQFLWEKKYQQMQMEMMRQQAQQEQAYRMQELAQQRELAGEELGWEKEMWEMRLAEDREQRLAQLAAEPISWLQYAALSGEEPVVQPWMLPLMQGDYPELQAGAPIPGWTVSDMSGMPALTTPSAQYSARMGPTSEQELLGYRQARTGAQPSESDFRMWNLAPPGRSMGLTQRR